MKDYTEVEKRGDQTEAKELQYGAWLRGEVLRKSMREIDQTGRRGLMDKFKEPNQGSNA